MVGGVKLHLESNPIPAREAQKAQKKKKIFCEPGPRDPTETEPDLPATGTGLWLHQTWVIQHNPP